MVSKLVFELVSAHLELKEVDLGERRSGHGLEMAHEESSSSAGSRKLFSLSTPPDRRSSGQVEVLWTVVELKGRRHSSGEARRRCTSSPGRAVRTSRSRR